MKSVTRGLGDKNLNRRMKLLTQRRKSITQPSVIEGLTRIFDIAGTRQDKPVSLMSTRKHVFSNESQGYEEDARKLASDWYTVVEDLDEATQKLVAKESLSK